MTNKIEPLFPKVRVPHKYVSAMGCWLLQSNYIDFDDSLEFIIDYNTDVIEVRDKQGLIDDFEMEDFS